MLVQAKKAVTQSIQPKKPQRSSRKEILQINNQIVSYYQDLIKNAALKQH